MIGISNGVETVLYYTIRPILIFVQYMWVYGVRYIFLSIKASRRYCVHFNRYGQFVFVMQIYYNILHPLTDNYYSRFTTLRPRCTKIIGYLIHWSHNLLAPIVLSVIYKIVLIDKILKSLRKLLFIYYYIFNHVS